MTLFRPPPTELQLIEKELEEAKSDYLRQQATFEYAKAMVEMLGGRMKRLRECVEILKKEAP